jgi:hypothetical protein
MNLWTHNNKDQYACTKTFMAAGRSGGSNSNPADEIFEVTRVSVSIAEMLRI